MRIRILRAMAGPEGTTRIGDEITVKADEGERLIAAGRAEEIKSKTKSKD